MRPNPWKIYVALRSVIGCNDLKWGGELMQRLGRSERG